MVFNSIMSKKCIPEIKAKLPKTMESKVMVKGFNLMNFFIKDAQWFYFGFENLVLPRNAGSSMGRVRDKWLCRNK